MEETKFPELPPEKQDERIPWKPANAVPRCEQSGGHIVKVKHWPLLRKPSDQPNEPPSEVAQCERCTGTVIVYNDTTPGVKVIKPALETAKK